jgi:hypothetical protein
MILKSGSQSSDKFTLMPRSPSLFRPRSLDEALAILADTPDARPISAGTYEVELGSVEGTA